MDLELTRSCVSATCVHPGGITPNIARVFDAMARVAPAGYQRLITGVVRSRSAT